MPDPVLRIHDVFGWIRIWIRGSIWWIRIRILGPDPPTCVLKFCMVVGDPDPDPGRDPDPDPYLRLVDRGPDPRLYLNESASLLLCTSCNFSLFPFIVHCLVLRKY
jgi:hypothetical protein